MGTRHQVLLSQAAGVKICLEAGERGRILLARGRDTMCCQLCSSLLCLVTVTGGGRGRAPRRPVRSRLGLFAALGLMKNAAPHRLIHGIGFSSKFTGLVPGEAGSILKQLWVEMGPPPDDFGPPPSPVLPSSAMPSPARATGGDAGDKALTLPLLQPPPGQGHVEECS